LDFGCDVWTKKIVGGGTHDFQEQHKSKKVGTPIGVPTFDSRIHKISTVETPGCARATTNCCWIVGIEYVHPFHRQATKHVGDCQVHSTSFVSLKKLQSQVRPDPATTLCYQKYFFLH